MFHSYLLEGMAGSHIAPKRGRSSSYYSAGAIEEDDDKLGQAVANMALTSLKRLVGRKAVIKTGTSRNAVCAFNKDRALHRG